MGRLSAAGEVGEAGEAGLEAFRLEARGLAARGREDGGVETADGVGFMARRREDVWRLRAACIMGLRRITCAI